MSLRRTILLLVCLAAVSSAAAQTTRVRGRVTDAATGQPVAFASVLFPGTTVGLSLIHISEPTRQYS